MPPKKTAGPPPHPKSDPIKPGTTFSDNNKRTITVGKELAQGGFGRICDVTVEGVSDPLIGKFEPGGNGPLFVEQSVFTRVLRKESLNKFSKEKKLDFLGLPYVVSNGMYNDIRYLIMPKYSHCLDHVIKSMGSLPVKNVKQVSHCVLNALEYLHRNEHAHADVKAGNLMMNSESAFDQVYLIDFGLCMRADKAVEKDNKKRAHNGTPFFTSTDAHRGIGPTYRGDIETLGHNVIYWLSGKIPWEKHETNPSEIFNVKKALLADLDDGLSQAGINDNDKKLISGFFEEASRLGVTDIPDFTKLHTVVSRTSDGTSKSKNEPKEEPTKRGRAKKKVEELSEETNNEVESKPSRGKGKAKENGASHVAVDSNDKEELSEKKKMKEDDFVDTKDKPIKRSRAKKKVEDESPEEINNEVEIKPSRGKGKQKKPVEVVLENIQQENNEVPNGNDEEVIDEMMKENDSDDAKEEPVKRSRKRVIEESSEETNEEPEPKVSRGKGKPKKTTKSTPEDTQSKHRVSDTGVNGNDKELTRKKKMKKDDSAEVKEEPVKRGRKKIEKEPLDEINDVKSKGTRGRGKQKKTEIVSEDIQPKNNGLSDGSNDTDKELGEKENVKEDDSDDVNEEPIKRSRTKKKIEEESSEGTNEEVEPKVSRGRGKQKKVVEDVLLKNDGSSPSDVSENDKRLARKKKMKDDAKEEPVKRARAKKIEEESSEEAINGVEPKPSRGKGRPKKATESGPEDVVPAKSARIAKSKKAPVKVRNG